MREGENESEQDEDCSSELGLDLDFDLDLNLNFGFNEQKRQKGVQLLNTQQASSSLWRIIVTAAAAPADTRPPEEVYETQLRQLNDMGFFDFDRNVRALRRSGGSVEGAIEMLFNGSV